MPKYLLSIYQPEGKTDPDAMTQIAADLHRLNEELRDSGSWVATGGLHAPGTEGMAPGPTMPSSMKRA